MLFKDKAVLFFPDSAHLCRYRTSCCIVIYILPALQRRAPTSKDNSCRTEPVSRVNSANVGEPTCDSSNYSTARDQVAATLTGCTLLPSSEPPLQIHYPFLSGNIHNPTLGFFSFIPQLKKI